MIGTVDGAWMQAGGSIEVTEGIVGHNKGHLQAGRNVKCSFIQDADVEAGEDIIVSQSIMHSRIRAGKHVICQGSNGVIVGGCVQAGEQVVARTVGNTMSTQTVVEVGILPELRNEMGELRKRLNALSESIDKSEKALVLLDQLAANGKLDPAKMQLRVKLTHTKKNAEQEQAEVRERILEIEKALEDADLATVDVGSVVYPGTKIVIGRYARFVKDPVKRVRFEIRDGDISMNANF